MGAVPNWLDVDLIRLDSSCSGGLVPTAASLPHEPRNKVSKVSMESWDLALSNGASWSNIGPFHGNRLRRQSQSSKMFPVEIVYRNRSRKSR